MATKTRPPRPPAMMCKTCLVPLQSRHPEGSDVIQWLHAGEPDHPVEPVLVDWNVANARCDFCSTPVITFQHIVRCTPFDFHEGSGNTFADDGNWACCEVCADLIKADQWTELSNHSVYCFERIHGDFDSPIIKQQVLAEVRSMHQRIRRNFLRIEDS